VYLLFYIKGISRLKFIVSALLFPFLFLFFIDFQFAELYHQLFIYSGEHIARGNVFQRIWHYFFSRFFPVYREQPWMPLLHLLIFYVAIKQVLSDYRKHIWAIVFLVTSITWMFFLSPNYRYWVLLYFISIPILATWLQENSIELKKYLKWYFIPVGLLVLFPFLSRHALAIAQRAERDPKKAIIFLENHIKDTSKILVFGDEISLYMTANHKNMDCGHALEPDNFHFADYKKVYFVTHDSLPGLALVDCYKPKAWSLPLWLNKLGRGGTHAGMKIYVVPDERAWKRATHPYYH
jgi:hypothetical protein